MLKNVLARLGSSSRVVIAEAPWTAALAALPFTARLTEDERNRLRALAEALLGDKEMAAAGDLELTAPMQIAIAVQACLPVLNLGLHWYRGWTSIVIYPSEFLVRREIADASGVVHEFTEPLSGESWQGGPLILSWDDAQRNASDDGHPFNVVIHEFVHKIDLLDGAADGVPPFDRRTHPGLDVGRWRAVLAEAFERFNAELDLIAEELPAEIDPDSEAADPWYAGLPLDPYAAHDEGEFFAVSSEVFFVEPARLREAFPDWYAQLALFFKQEPIAP